MRVRVCMCVCVCACACVCMCVYARVCATSSYMHSTSGPLRHHAVAYVANHRCLPRTNLNKHLLPHRDRRDTTMAPRRGLAWAVAATVVVSAAAAVVWEGHADMRLALAAAETAAPADYVPPGVREQIALQWQGLNRRHAHCPACATARAVARAAAIQSLTRVGAVLGWVCSYTLYTPTTYSDAVATPILLSIHSAGTSPFISVRQQQPRSPRHCQSATLARRLHRLTERGAGVGLGHMDGIGLGGGGGRLPDSVPQGRGPHLLCRTHVLRLQLVYV
jgi:hypothetical protein